MNGTREAVETLAHPSALRRLVRIVSGRAGLIAVAFNPVPMLPRPGDGSLAS